jgi:hypothetical protein
VVVLDERRSIVTENNMSAAAPAATLHTMDESATQTEASHAVTPNRATGVTYHILTPKLNPIIEIDTAPVDGTFWGCVDLIVA